MTEKFISYKTEDGRIFDIPESRSVDFENKYPSATIEMHANDKVYDIPLSEKQRFIDKYGESASYVFDNSAEETSSETEKEDRTSWGETAIKGLGAAGVRTAKLALDLGRMAFNTSSLGAPINKIRQWTNPEHGTIDEELRDETNPLTRASMKLGEVADRLSREADPTGGEKGFTELIREGKIGQVAQKALGSGLESLPMMVAAGTGWGALLYGAGMAAGEYADETRDNPDIPSWKRGVNSIGAAALEMAVEKIGGPLKNIGSAGKEITESMAKEILETAIKEGTENVAKRIVKKITKQGLEEGSEEVITSVGTDVLGQALDVIDGDSDYGFTAQWEQMKEQNPNASIADFAKAKAEEYMDSFIGGAVSGMEISGVVDGANNLANRITGNIMDKARNFGASMDYGNMYDTDSDIASAKESVAKSFTNDNGEQAVSNEFIESLSADDAFALSGREDFSGEQRRAFRNLAIKKATQDGLSKKLDDAIENMVSEGKAKIEAVVENGNITTGKVGDKAVYVKGGIVKDGHIYVGEDGAVGPVIVIDPVTGEETTVNSNEITSASVNDAATEIAKFETNAREYDAQLREKSRTTMSDNAKFKAVKPLEGKKMMVDLGNGLIEVKIQQILPESREVIIKGKKGDLDGKSNVKVSISSFYDSISRDDEGKPIIIEGADEFVEESVEEAPVNESIEEPITDEDYRDFVGNILIDGVPTEVEVESQDDPSNTLVFRYTDANGNTRRVSSTIGAFKSAIQQSDENQPEPAPVSEPIEEPITESVVVPEEQVEEAPITPEAINWDALFEQDPEAYFTELQNQFGEETLDILNEEIEAAQSELDALGKAKTKSQNERLENRKKKAVLQNRIGILNGMVSNLTPVEAVIEEAPVETEALSELEAPVASAEQPVETTAEETPIVEEQITEETISEEPTPEEPVVSEAAPAQEEAQAVEQQPLVSAPVAPNPVANPVREAQKKEKSLATQLKRIGIPHTQKQDMAFNAGKKVGDMFATREEYEVYEENATDLGEYNADFERGVEESFANRQPKESKATLSANIKSDIPYSFISRKEGESATDFYESVIENYKSKYNSLCPIDAYDVDEVIAARFGYTLDELRKKYGLYERTSISDLIAIFVREDVDNSAIIENTIFHEIIHYLSVRDNKLMEFGKWLWDNAEIYEVFSDYKAGIEAEYNESDYYAEMLSYCVSYMMSVGATEELSVLLPYEYQDIVKDIENEIGYDRQTEASTRGSKTETQFTAWSDNLRIPEEEDNGRRKSGERESKKVAGTEVTIEDEMESIKNDAIANGTFMKAPNGHPTKLSERQWLQVRTKNFLNWFGDWINDPENASKVVDPDTKEPRVVYHGTGSEFFVFRNSSEDNELGAGFYFTDSYDTAERYAKDENLADNQNRIQSRADDIFFDIMGHSSEDLYDNDSVGDYNVAYEQAVYELFSNSHVKSVFLNIRRPYIVADDKSGVSIYDGATLAHNYNDGIIDNEFSDRHNTLSGVQYVVFNPNQIKSATDNEGAFDVENPDIRKRLGENNDKFVSQFEQKQNNERQELEYSDEFRRVQEESARMSEQEVSEYHRGQRRDGQSIRQRLGAVFQKELERRNQRRNDLQLSVVNESKGTTFDIIKNVDGRIFHDIFAIVRNYLPNGELVDLHDSYEDAICYITTDGLAGFAVTSDGNLISVFSLYGGSKRGFLGAIKDLVTEAGATRLDGYNSINQPLAEIYATAFGWKVASMMDYNMEYDHDNIAENHGMPQVAFMVNTDAEIETKHFNKDQYDEAEGYQKEQAAINAKVEAQNAAVNFLIGNARLRAIENAVNEEAAKLGVTVTYKTREDMPKGHKNDKGYYNTKTGEIVVCTENATSIEDAIKTILHESVAHKGLRQLMGDKFNEFINRVYESLDAETKAKVNAIAAANYNGNTAVAMEEYMASLAETEDFANNSVWEKIKSIFNDIINSILGRNDIKIGDNELRYILRASYANMVNPRNMETIDGWAKDTNMRNELGINEATPEILSRTGIDPTEATSESAKEVYNRVVANQWQEFQRQFQDRMQPVRIAIDAIQQETGNIPIEDYENFILIHNQISSRSRVEIDTFARRYYSPIVNQINKMIDMILESRGLNKKDETKRAEVYAEIRQYMIAKHGLERNLYYQANKTRRLKYWEKKKAIAEAQKEYDEKVNAINADETLTDSERELQLREAKGAFDAARLEVETREVPDMRDYAGLTALFGMDSKDFKKAEAEAQRVIDEFESKVGDASAELWKKINRATDKTLRHSYESGLLSRQQYNDIKAMFKFYIPLRGFDETTAEDVYSYSRFEGNRFNPAVQTAKGRTSLADDPLAIIMNMAESEIAQGNKNRAKQALYNFILNRTRTDENGNQIQNSLMRVESVWYIKNEDSEGNAYYTIATPNHASGKTYEEFEERMIALEAEDKAYKSKKGKVDVGMRFQKPANAGAHYVYLKVNGVEKAIYINGDPKAAEAINGVNQKPMGELEQKMRNINRILSSTFTNYSLEFTARNYFRDMFYSHINIGIRESDPAYRKKFRQNWRHNNLGAMIKLLKDYRAGELEGIPLTEDESAFVDFMQNGGQTGYTLINSVENHKKDLERAIKNMQKGIEHGGVKDSAIFKATLGGIELLNEASELVTRFAAFKTSRDMGRSINKSISDAKEITVNFNTKGAQDGKGFAGWVSKYLGATKFFFNASVQGVQNIKAMADANKLKFCGTVGGVMAFGFMMPVIISAIASILGADDDDEEYWNIPEYERQNNFCIPVGGGKYVKVPLPIGFREVYALGDMVAAMAFDKKFTRDAQQVGMDMANKIASVVLPINPLEGSANGLSFWHIFLNTAAPSSAQFIVQNYGNIDWKGAPLQKEYTYNENDPQWMKAYASNPDWMVGLSKWCNEHIGDGDLKGMDWSPEKLDNTLSNLFGGIYSLTKKTGKAFSMIWNEENRNLSNIPLTGVVLGSGIDNDDRFVTDAYYDQKEYYDDRIGTIKRAASAFGYSLDDVFLYKKGAHQPKMQEIYSSDVFDFMQEWYKGNKELEAIDKQIKKFEKEIAKHAEPSEGMLNRLAEMKDRFAVERREFVNDMLELD